MATKDDVTDFFLHLALKWQQLHYTDTSPSIPSSTPIVSRNNFFRREALNLRLTSKGGVRTIITAMLEYPDKADYVFDQHFHCIMQYPPSHDCHPLNKTIEEKFHKGLITNNIT